MGEVQVLNKADAVEDDALEALARRLLALNPGALIVPAEHGRIGFAALDALYYRKLDRENGRLVSRDPHGRTSALFSKTGARWQPCRLRKRPRTSNPFRSPLTGRCRPNTFSSSSARQEQVCGAPKGSSTSKVTDRRSCTTQPTSSRGNLPNKIRSANSTLREASLS